MKIKYNKTHFRYKVRDQQRSANQQSQQVQVS